MLVEMKKLIVDCKTNKTNLDTMENNLIEQLEACSAIDNYAPTQGQISFLNLMANKPSKSSSNEKFSGKTSKKSKGFGEKLSDFGKDFKEK